MCLRLILPFLSRNTETETLETRSPPAWLNQPLLQHGSQAVGFVDPDAVHWHGTDNGVESESGEGGSVSEDVPSSAFGPAQWKGRVIARDSTAL